MKKNVIVYGGFCGVNKRAVENFIKCGAMDCFGYHRSELLAVYDSMMDAIAQSRKKNLEGQMGLFGMLEDDDPSTSIPIPKLPEISAADRMAMEKETTGIYLSGHPMDDYRKYLKNTHVVPMAKLMDEESSYEDDQIVSVAGIVQSVKMKTTRNNSMMAYVTVEDDTASMEMLAFSNVLSQFGNYLTENAPVVITGRLSMRDDKDPQIVINRARPMTDFSENVQPEPPEKPKKLEGTLWLKLESQNDPRYGKIKAIVNMFPGNSDVRVFFADIRKMSGAKADLDARMILQVHDELLIEAHRDCAEEAKRILKEEMENAVSYGAATAAVPSKDTIKVADDGGFISATPDRSKLWLTQTPQIFRRESYLSAMKQAEIDGVDCTDDCQLVERMGEKVFLSQGSYFNIKITTPEDIPFAEAIVGAMEG